MLVRLVCVFVGRRRLVAVEVDSLDYLDEVEARLHDFLGVSCSVDQLRVYLAEKRRFRAWLRTDDEAVDDLRSGCEPPKEFKKMYLGKGNELDAGERIQDFIPERFARVPGEVHLFVVAPETSTSTACAPPSPPVQKAPPPRCLSRRTRHRRRQYRSSLARRFGGFCVAHGGGKCCSCASCTKKAQSGGFCRGHGGGARCKHEDCSRAAKEGGFCISHGGGKRGFAPKREESVV